jgi:hypothetical protein
MDPNSPNFLKQLQDWLNNQFDVESEDEPVAHCEPLGEEDLSAVYESDEEDDNEEDEI